MQRRATSLKMIKLSKARPQGQERGLRSAYWRCTQRGGQLARATAIRRSPGREVARDAGYRGPRSVWFYTWWRLRQDSLIPPNFCLAALDPNLFYFSTGTTTLTRYESVFLVTIVPYFSFALSSYRCGDWPLSKLSFVSHEQSIN